MDVNADCIYMHEIDASHSLSMNEFDTPDLHQKMEYCLDLHTYTS